MLRRLRIDNLVLIRDAELEFSPGLNAVTGETGAGKTIFAQAIGLLLGARADASLIGADGDEAYVEAELDLPAAALTDDALAPLLELRPADEPGLVAARRVFPDGRTRAYAWGRSVAREDLAAAVERLVAMSGQYEQRRLARASYRLDLLDAVCGPEQASMLAGARRAWRDHEAARRLVAELSADEDARRLRAAELERLVADTAELDAAEEESLKHERERLRHLDAIVTAVAQATAALDPDDAAGAAELASAAERSLAPLEDVAPELSGVGVLLRDALTALQEARGDLARFAATLDTDAGRADAVEERLLLWADLRRRYRCATAAELLELRDAAISELAELAGGDPLDAAGRALEEAERALAEAADALHEQRTAAAPVFAADVAQALVGLGLGEGEFGVDVRPRAVGPAGRDEVVFLFRPNAGLPFAPVAETASGGELSRIALAIAAVGGGETLVFDEIDAGIGGVTAHAVAETLQQLATRAQVLTITHLPQIASVADAHFRVEKVAGDPTRTHVTRLSNEERGVELERMLGGGTFLATVTRGTRGD